MDNFKRQSRSTHFSSGIENSIGSSSKLGAYCAFFAISLTVLSSFILCLLAGFSTVIACGVSVLIAATLTSSYFLIQMNTYSGQNRTRATKSSMEQSRKASSNTYKAYVDLNDSKVHKAITKQRLESHKQMVQPIKHVEVAATVRRTEKELSVEEKYEAFKQDPLSHLRATKQEIMLLLDKSQESFQKLESVFGLRLHKNTRNDISNFLLLQKLTKAFHKRLEEIIDTLDTVSTDQKLNVARGFALAYAPLELANDSVSSLSDSSVDVAPIQKEHWESTLTSLLKQIARKKTFHQALQTANFR